MKPCMNKELEIRRVDTINCGYCDKKQGKSTESIFVTFLFVSKFIFDSQVNEFFSTLRVSKLEK